MMELFAKIVDYFHQGPIYISTLVYYIIIDLILIVSPKTWFLMHFISERHFI